MPKYTEGKELESYLTDKYIEDTKITDQIKTKDIVVIDPGHNDLINCMNKNGKRFRYTRGQRNVETRHNKYLKIEDKIKKKTTIKDKSIKEIESELSVYNSKTRQTDAFKDYLKKKIEINRRLYDHYLTEIYRKLKFNRYTNTRKSEDKMMKKIEEIYGKPEDVLVIFGDYSKKGTNKGSQPAITKRMRRLFREHKYELYLINEYNTSKICNKCHSETENFMNRKKSRKQIRKMKKEKIIEEKKETFKLWKLIRCTSEDCQLIHNRDEEYDENNVKTNKRRKEGRNIYNAL